MDEGTVFQPRPQGSLRPGVRLNGMFEIERLIAEGGMGEVYKGLALASGDPVAIKLVRPEMARHPDVMALFKREAAILHNLLHDAIVRYYVFSIEPELQRAYIAMEFVDGVSLQKKLASGPLTTAEIRILLKRIGGALEVAHANGVVHRDISSDNIILPNGDPRRAKIVDFGIARDAQATEGTIIGGGVAGKYKYMSPEQLGLAGGEVTPKSDIYSFGLVVAEALRGKPIDMGSTQVDTIEKRKRVPDLSGIDVALRPLLTAMLAPNPDDRPASMAEVAVWGETGERTQIAAPAAAARVAEPRRRAWGALLAAGAAVAVMAAAGYALRGPISDAVGPWLAAGPAPTPTSPKLPPLPTATPTPTVAVETPTTSPSPSPSAPSPVATESPSKQALLEQLPPRAAQTEVALAPATAGAALRAELPAFADPGGKGLALHAAPAPPPGLALHDLGGGRSALEGAPTTPGRYDFEVVAVNQAGKSARMKVALNVAGAPPQPAQSLAQLEPATIGSPYSAGLPPFRSPEKLSLRAEGLPAGLAFADLGGGLSQLTGKPTQAGDFEFDVVATTPSGVEGRMKVRVEVASATPTVTPTPPTPSVVATSEPSPTVAPSPSPTPSLATPSPSPAVASPSPPAVSMRAQAAAFLAARPPEPCFAVRLDGDDGARFVAMGAERSAFGRFETDYKRRFQRDPDTRAELIAPTQCPVAELAKLDPASAAAPPLLTLDNLEVGPGRPLSGAITGLGKRALLLFAVGDDGRAVKVRPQLADDGQSASFSLGITGDAASVGKPQLLVALASDRPFDGLDAFRAGPSAELEKKLAGQWRPAGASAAAALFRFAN